MPRTNCIWTMQRPAFYVLQIETKTNISNISQTKENQIFKLVYEHARIYEFSIQKIICMLMDQRSIWGKIGQSWLHYSELGPQIYEQKDALYSSFSLPFPPHEINFLKWGEKSGWNKKQSWAEGHSLWQIVMTLPHLSGSAALTPGNTHHTDLCTIAQNWLFSDNQVSQTPSERRKEMLPCKNSCSTKASGYVCALWPRAATDTQRPLTIKLKTSRLKHKGTSETCCYTARIVFTIPLGRPAYFLYSQDIWLPHCWSLTLYEHWYGYLVFRHSKVTSFHAYFLRSQSHCVQWNLLIYDCIFICTVCFILIIEASAQK